MRVEPRLLATKISKSFDDTTIVLDQISIEVRPGTILAIVGQSGSGKSTLLNTLSGIEVPTEGEVIRQGSMAYLTQQDILFPWRNVIENVLLPAELDGSVCAEKIREAEAFLHLVELFKQRDSFPSVLSGGMKQQAALARLLLQNPQIALFDEPFSAIDFDARLRLVRQIRKWVCDTAKIGVFVTHHIEEAISIADDIIVIAGRPARIMFQSKIEIAEEYRDPISVRKAPCFHNLFEEVWNILCTRIQEGAVA